MVVLSRYLGILAASLSATSFSAENLLLYHAKEVYNPIFIVSCNALTFFLCVTLSVAYVRPQFEDGYRRHLPMLLFVGFLGGLEHTAIALAVFVSGPGDATLIFYSTPIFAIVFSVMFLKDSFKWSDILLALLALAAVALIYGSNEKSENMLVVEGVLFALFSAVGSAGVLVMTKILTNGGIDTFIVLFSYSSGYLLVATAVCTVLQDWTIPTDVNTLFLALSSGLAMFGGLLMKFLALLKERPAIVSMILTIEVFLSYLGDVALFHRSVYWTTYVSFALIMSSCIGAILTHTAPETNENEEQEHILPEQ